MSRAWLSSALTAARPKGCLSLLLFGSILSAMVQIPSELDEELRDTAFQALGRITEPTGGLITRAQMTEGFGFRGERIPFSDRGRGIWRPRQLGPDGAALSVCTAAVRPGHDPPYDDGIGNDEGWIAYRYQRNGPDAWDNAALRNAYFAGRRIIYFSGVTRGLYSAVFPTYVTADDRGAQTFLLASIGAEVPDPVAFMANSPQLVKRYMLRNVKQRLHQDRFRERVIAAYRKRCTVCRLRHPELLDAAHILEDRDVRGLPEVPNGLALCKIHHRAYDVNILGIAPDRRIHIRQDVLDEIDGPMLQHGLKGMHGELISVPRSEALRPKPEYLEERFDRFKRFRAA